MSRSAATPMARQGGLIAVALVLLGALSGIGLLLAHQDFAAVARARIQARSIAVLAQARAALAGYALSYPERHPGQGYGYLPCPDAGDDGSPLGACHARDLGAIGRFPYRTLGLGDLRDGAGACLWYAVAGSVKANPKPLVLNWDSPGQFDIIGANGAPLTATNASAASAVAVIFAAGPLQPGQRRPQSGGRCGGGETAATALADHLDLAYPSAVTGRLAVHQGSTGSLDNNDLLAWISTDDIFDALRRRADFVVFIDSLVTRAGTALRSASLAPGFIEQHADTLFAETAGGPLPDAAALGIPTDAAAAHDNWRDQFRFLLCRDGSPCLTALLGESAAAPGTPLLEPCRLVLLFAGERIRHGADRQTRATEAERAHAPNYFEGPNPAVLTSGGGQLTGYRRFAVVASTRPAHEDVIQCLI